MNPHLLAGVELASTDIPTSDLNRIYLALTAGWPFKHLPGADHLVPLCTEEGGECLHPETVMALGLLVGERLSQSWEAL